MKIYFEYKKEDYYGLIVVETKGLKNYEHKADEIYHHHMGDDSIKAIDAKYNPDEVSKEYAFWKYINCDGIEQMQAREVLDKFNSSENTCLVIDGSLVQCPVRK